jgi:hypothetical protein
MSISRSPSSNSFELILGDAINSHRRHGTEGSLACANSIGFPPATLIRLFGLLKNNSRLLRDAVANDLDQVVRGSGR